MNSIQDQLIQAVALQNQGSIDQAVALFNKVLSVDRGNAPALYSLAVIALNAGNPDEVLRLCESGVASAPAFAPLRFVKGAALQSLGRKEEALASFDEALKLEPNATNVLINSGVILRDLLRHGEALERFNRALTLEPDNVAALGNCGILLSEFKQGEHAIRMFKRLLELDPSFPYGPGLLCFEQLHICDWRDLPVLSAQIVEGIRAGQRSCKTLAFMSISDSASDHLADAKIFARHMYSQDLPPLWNGERYKHDKIRIAYVSPDFREHPVGHVLAGVIEHHDRDRFELVGISLGVDDQSRLRSRFEKAFDRFVDARTLGSRQIAETMRSLEIDIAIDLAGYTADSRNDIFAYRPAPVQANYLGYPGTLGTDYMDYIIADRHIIPEEHQAFYSEQVVYLPDTYMPTDASLTISERTPTRAECGLPDQGVVFCSFSHDYKLNPTIFGIWMRLLERVPGSVLWLMSRNEASQRNLREAAAERGIDPNRLIFASRVPRVEDHLARYRQADVFLDTHPYNAHTTAADALMAGLPVVTYMGNSFPARVAGSIVHAMGVPELATHSLVEYEELAFRLATSPEMLESFREKLRKNRETCALLDTRGFCRNLEAIYFAMWRKSQLCGAHDALCGPKTAS
jgi:predicted O-linked N-acetylglucosamine transferase (SPINDLY family)